MFFGTRFEIRVVGIHVLQPVEQLVLLFTLPARGASRFSSDALISSFVRTIFGFVSFRLRDCKMAFESLEKVL
jgi:hypothetical protein